MNVYPYMMWLSVVRACWLASRQVCPCSVLCLSLGNCHYIRVSGVEISRKPPRKVSSVLYSELVYAVAA